MKGTPLLRVKGIAQDLDVSESTIRRAIKEKELAAIKVRGQYRIRQDDYSKYQDTCKARAQA